MEWKRKILWAVLVALVGASLPLLGVDMENFIVPTHVLAAAWGALAVVFYHEFKPDVLGWFGRKNTPAGFEVWEEDRGRGDLAATLIKSASTFGKAEEIFDHCRHDKQPRKLETAIDAMASRLIKEGRTDETMQFLENEDLGPGYKLAVSMPPVDGATDWQYQWVVTVFQGVSKEQI
ncbi:MAG: hypothetical protein OXM03_04420 [Chloroflexota bacterium]|nr:hypothetical protein [Caldilineaceae bacterium]MDE0455176.1 hypothetical protein [Gammaproteobacteria bacterium]MDE2839853.1 hypothetical protein [Chloroflexota bacterium]